MAFKNYMVIFVRTQTLVLSCITAQGWQGPWKAALTSGSLSATGDLLAQFGQGQINQVCKDLGCAACCSSKIRLCTSERLGVV
eukprot:114901-Pelagomonas_calceolata.AAC.2